MHKPRRKRVVIMIMGHASASRQAAQGVLDYCRAGSRWEIHFEATTDVHAIRRVEHAVRDWRANGFIGYVNGRALARVLHAAGIPAIDLGGEQQPGLTTVAMDDDTTGRLVAGHFLERGFRNMAYFGYAEYSHSRVRQDGFTAAVEEAGGSSCQSFLLRPIHTATGWITDQAALRPWLSRLPKPVGIMACNDLLAREIISCCERGGLRVPDDVGVVGVDNDELECGLCTVPISSVMSPAHQIGMEAGRILDRMMRQPKWQPEPTRLPPQGIAIRRSSDVYAVEDEAVAAALAYIRDHVHQPVTVGDILGQVHVSRRALEWRFVKVLGRTPRKIILQAHIDRARMLLTESNLKLSAVATQAGFSPHQVFSKILRQALGMTPSQYRQRHRRP